MAISFQDINVNVTLYDIYRKEEKNDQISCNDKEHWGLFHVKGKI